MKVHFRVMSVPALRILQALYSSAALSLEHWKCAVLRSKLMTVIWRERLNPSPKKKLWSELGFVNPPPILFFLSLKFMIIIAILCQPWLFNLHTKFLFITMLYRINHNWLDLHNALNNTFKSWLNAISAGSASSISTYWWVVYINMASWS